MSEWFYETLHKGYRQSLEITKELFREKTDFQDMIIFENPIFGRVLALDGVVQTNERDEFVYHEMQAHVPIVAHGAVKKVLIIGGGDGGVLREVLRHPDIMPTMVEIDRSVVDLCVKYLPSLSDGAFDNERTNLIIDDGLKFVAQTEDRFDVIIVDSTDPHGPGEVLFTQQFYSDCKRCLTDGGILVTQNGVPFFQGSEVTNSYNRLKTLFKDVSFYAAPVPTYVGGIMTLGWASDNASLRTQSRDLIEQRLAPLNLTTKYYNAGIHTACFSLPNYVLDLMIDA